MRINRYIVGCKYFSISNREVKVCELIDTQWDVNVVAVQQDLALLTELIDTQWDVNTKEYLDKVQEDLELIDTQWDVNKDDSEIVLPLTKN